ncbi:MAG: ATP-binding protein, partial [Gudongella sp.]|nr:ATP-binding protein [Gudongella sp.]
IKLPTATLLALLITIILGFLIASSITEPKRDVTKKAEEMSMGDFDQFVEVKSDDELGQLAGMFNQLTMKLKQTIGEMDLERSKLDTIFSYMAEGVIAVDRNGFLIHANPIGQKLMDLEEKDFHQDTMFNMEYLDLDSIDYNDPSTLNGEIIHETIDGVYKVKYAPYRDERDSIAGIIMVFQDITQEHKLENMRKEFVANVSHELKTPITTIKSYTETLMGEDIPSDVHERFLSVIDSECDRMARLVRDLLQLSNLDYKKTKWAKVRIDVNELIRDILLKLDVLLQEKSQETDCDLSNSSAFIMGDRDGIEQVLINVISNAIKYTEDNGKIQISTNISKGRVRIRVKDNGIGIPSYDLDRIFERFYRVEKGRSRNLGGTGLGLSIAKEIIEAHNGEIKLISKDGEGTTADIYFPLA